MHACVRCACSASCRSRFPSTHSNPLPESSPTPPVHAARQSGHISGLLSLLNAKTGEEAKARPRCLLKGQSAVVEVTPSRPKCLEDYGSDRALGRVALLDGGRTIAVGIISAVPPPPATADPTDAA